MTQIDDDTRRRAERARRVGLFRYELIQEVIDPALSTRARGRLVRALAEREHTGPFGEPVRVSRHTIDRWIRDWRSGGFEALVPAPGPSHPAHPGRGAGAGGGVEAGEPGPHRRAGRGGSCAAQSGWAPSDRTLQRTSTRLELHTARRETAATRGAGGVRPVRGRAAATSCGPVTRCTAPSSAAARRICSRSSTTIPGR